MMGVSALAKAFTKLKPVLLLFQKVVPTVVAGFKALGVALSGLSLAAKAVSGVIGFLVVDFIAGAIQAENFKRKIADLREIMETSTDDAERYLAAVELWNKTESVEAMKVMNEITEKYGLTVEDLTTKTAEEIAIFIRQTQVQKEAEAQVEALTDALKGLTVAGRKNIQTFDEVNQIQEEGEDTSIVGGLDDDLNDMKKVAKDTAEKLTKLGKAIDGVGDASKDGHKRLR